MHKWVWLAAEMYCSGYVIREVKPGLCDMNFIAKVRRRLCVSCASRSHPCPSWDRPRPCLCCPRASTRIRAMHDHAFTLQVVARTFLHAVCMFVACAFAGSCVCVCGCVGGGGARVRQVDPKGWVPVWVVNLAAAQQSMNLALIRDWALKKQAQFDRERRADRRRSVGADGGASAAAPSAAAAGVGVSAVAVDTGARGGAHSLPASPPFVPRAVGPAEPGLETLALPAPPEAVLVSGGHGVGRVCGCVSV
jgi:hypothetical protein